MEAARGGDADARTKMSDMRTKRNDAIKALLTAEQKAQFDKLMAGRRTSRRWTSASLVVGRFTDRESAGRPS